MKKIYFFLAVLQIMQVMLAIACGPHSCEWGNTVYFYGGVACLIISVLLPFFTEAKSTGQRLLHGVLFLLISMIVWGAGFMLFGFRIMCRLF